MLAKHCIGDLGRWRSHTRTGYKPKRGGSLRYQMSCEVRLHLSHASKWLTSRTGWAGPSGKLWVLNVPVGIDDASTCESRGATIIGNVRRTAVPVLLQELLSISA